MALPKTQSSALEEEEDILPEEEQTNKPKDVAVQQQRVKAWNPILDPNWVLYSFLVLAAIMIPVGFKMATLSNDVVEVTKIYDSFDLSEVGESEKACTIGDNYNANQTCSVEIVIPEDMSPPILIYYELTNFHQNHRSYSRSRDDFQLTGLPRVSSFSSACNPLNKLGDIELNPCGVIANTFFNDIIELQPGALDADDNEVVMVEEGIAWQSDIEYRFKMPLGYEQVECPAGECNDACCESNGFSCTSPAIDKKTGKCFAFNYIDENTTQYLYETYPDIISPLEHVTNEHFIVWMRVATLPDFRKLYGYIEQPLRKGTVLTFNLRLNYVVNSFEGSKALVVSSNNIFGGVNPYLAPTFYGFGFFFLASGIFFAGKHWIRPRKLADKKYLKYKEH